VAASEWSSHGQKTAIGTRAEQMRLETRRRSALFGDPVAKVKGL